MKYSELLEINFIFDIKLDRKKQIQVISGVEFFFFCSLALLD